MAKLRLTIDVDVDLRDVGAGTILRNLKEVAALAYREGLITGNHDAEIIRWSSNAEVRS